tara:strand:- start:458 stop:1036 length:579 start_codon:yes stop_codon:yes gene_type:complete
MTDCPIEMLNGAIIHMRNKYGDDSNFCPEPGSLQYERLLNLTQRVQIVLMSERIASESDITDAILKSHENGTRDGYAQAIKDLKNGKSKKKSPVKVSPTKKPTKSPIKEKSTKKSPIKAKPKKNIDNKTCQCRIWNRGLGGQCTRFALDNTEMCKAHTKKPAGLGFIYEPRPDITAEGWIDGPGKNIKKRWK